MPTTHESPKIMRPPLPREHGAWGILGGAFLTAAAVAGTVTAGMGLFLSATVAFYCSRHALLLAMRRRERRRGAIWFLLFALLGLILLTTAAAISRYWPIIYWSALLIPFLLIELLLIRARRQLSFFAQFTGTIGLTVVAPLTHILFTAGWTGDAGAVWLLAALFFTGLILFVRYQIHLMGSAVERVRMLRVYRTALFCYNGTLTAALIALAAAGDRFASALVPFMPSILQALLAGFGVLKTETVKQLGWLQMAHTLIFLALSALFLR